MIVMSAKVLLYFGTLSIIETHHTGHASAQNIDDSGYYIHTILTESTNGLLYHITFVQIIKHLINELNQSK